MKSAVRNVSRVAAVTLFGVIAVCAFIGAFVYIETFVGSVIVGAVALLLALLLIAYRPRRD